MSDKNALLRKKLDPVRKDLESKRDKVLKGLAPLYKERDKLVARVQPIEAELRQINHEIREQEKPLRAIGNDLAAIARAVGGAKSMALEASDVTATPGDIE